MLAAQMDGIQAEEQLRRGNVPNAEVLRELILAATGDEKAAQDAHSKAEMDRLSRLRRE